MTDHSDHHLFPLLDRINGSIRMIIHGGALKGCEEYVTSNPVPVLERGRFPGFVIEVAVDQLDQINPDVLPRIQSAWLHDHSDHKLIKRLPELLRHLPAMRDLSLTDSRLNNQLFQRGVPAGVETLRVLGSGRAIFAGPPNPDLQYLDTMVREFHPRLSPEMFPKLKGLAVHIGRKSDKKDRREMWEVINSFSGLDALHIEPGDHDLPWRDLHAGLTRLKLGNGDMHDLACLQHLANLEFLQLHHLRALKTLDGITALSALRGVVLLGMDRLSDYSALLDLPRLSYVHLLLKKCPEVCAALHARGVKVQGYR